MRPFQPCVCEQQGASRVKTLAVGAPISHNEAACPGTQCPILRLDAALTGLRKKAAQLRLCAQAAWNPSIG